MFLTAVEVDASGKLEGMTHAGKGDTPLEDTAQLRRNRLSPRAANNVTSLCPARFCPNPMEQDAPQ
jgi:hypothetical protein